MTRLDSEDWTDEVMLSVEASVVEVETWVLGSATVVKSKQSEMIRSAFEGCA